jgi:plastocyanin
MSHGHAVTRIARRIVLPIAALGALVAGAAPAAASLQIASTGEPPYTNSTTNTWFVDYVATGDVYRVLFRFSDQFNTLLTEYSPNVPGGTQGLMTNTQSGLSEGRQYTVCGSGQQWWNYLGAWAPEANGSCWTIGKNATVTVDRTPPAISVSVNGADIYSKSLAMTYRINYQDALSPPFPANFVCRSTDTPGSCATFDYVAACSQPIFGNVRQNAFECTETLPPAQPDGPVYFCARSADQAVPDIPGNADQFTGSTADKANLSAVGCGSVILDRTSPSITATANGTPAALTVRVGDLVRFATQASDATSGVGTINWTFGDNTSPGSGAATTHTYTQAGTYTATAATSDGAGNPSTSPITITVQPPTAGGTNGSTGSGSTTTTVPTVKQISAQGGGAGTQTATAAGLQVIAPKRVTITRKLKGIALALTAPGPGRATVTLVRGNAVIATGGTIFSRAGRVGFTLKLPKKLTPGRYTLTVTFIPKGTRTGTSRTLPLRLTGTARLTALTTDSRHGVRLAGAPTLTAR